MADTTTLNSIMDYVTTGAERDGMVDERLMTHADDPDMSAMMATAKRMHWASSAVVGPLFVALGLVGNLLSIIVWTRPHMKSSTGRYLTALAIADCLVLVWFILTDTIRVLHPEIDNSPAYAAFFAWLGYPLFFLWVICSIWFMVGVTVDRFIMVCLISKTKEFCNEKRANVGIFLISGLCFLINMPHFWSFTVRYPDDQTADPLSANSSAQPALVKTDFQRRTAGIYEFWVHCIFLVLAPWFSVFTLNMLIISKIGRTNRRMSTKKTAKSADKSRRAENQITRLLLIVTFTFLVLIGFQCITQCFAMLLPAGYDHVLIDEAYSIAKLGVIINSSTNFFLYCVSGRRFRQELLRVIGWTKLSHARFSSSDHSSGSTSGTSGTTGM